MQSTYQVCLGDTMMQKKNIIKNKKHELFHMYLDFYLLFLKFVLKSKKVW